VGFFLSLHEFFRCLGFFENLLVNFALFFFFFFFIQKKNFFPVQASGGFCCPHYFIVFSTLHPQGGKIFFFSFFFRFFLVLSFFFQQWERKGGKGKVGRRREKRGFLFWGEGERLVAEKIFHLFSIFFFLISFHREVGGEKILMKANFLGPPTFVEMESG
jgi:hypothetical protein